MPREDISWALADFRDRRRDEYDLARRYYDGHHRMAFATERFTTVFGQRFQEVADNLCPAIVDSLADRLELTALSSSAATTETVTENGRTRTHVTDELGAAAWSIWTRNRMKARANEVHREALLTGDGYVIVWPDPTGRAAIWPQVAEEIAVRYSDTIPGVIDLAARLWRFQGQLRLNLYYPGHIERYVTRTARERFMTRLVGAMTSRPGVRPQTARGVRPASLGAAAFDLLPGDDGIVLNPFGRVPVFHYPNKRLYDYGVSELRDVIPLQDTLNKAVCDMIVAMEFAAFRQRWATGLEVDTDDSGKPKAPPFQPGVDRIFAIDDPNARFGEFAETNLEQFLKVQEDLRAEIARVSGTPLHYLFIARGDFPSGEAMKSAEARFSKKIGDRQETFGNVWEDALKFALAVEIESGATEPSEVPDELDLSSLWETATPRSDEEHARTLMMKSKLGVSSRQILKELGYGDDVVEQMLEENAAAAPPPPADDSGGNDDAAAGAGADE